jgi:hypothetical protein
MIIGWMYNLLGWVALILDKPFIAFALFLISLGICIVNLFKS